MWNVKILDELMMVLFNKKSYLLSTVEDGKWNNYMLHNRFLIITVIIIELSDEIYLNSQWR